MILTLKIGKLRHPEVNVEMDKMEWKREISYVSERRKVTHVTNMLVVNSKLIQVHAHLFSAEFKNLNLIKTLSQ